MEFCLFEITNNINGKKRWKKIHIFEISNNVMFLERLTTQNVSKRQFVRNV
jgi:hypothetical protein